MEEIVEKGENGSVVIKYLTISLVSNGLGRWGRITPAPLTGNQCSCRDGDEEMKHTVMYSGELQFVRE
jgi:hypothetical protein